MRKLQQIAEEEEIRSVAQAFCDRATLGMDCRIGRSAWCVNSGPKTNIRLGDSVICRGLLRSEDFHPGQILIGDHVYLGDDTILSCSEQIEIGRFALLAHGVQVFDNNSHPLDPELREKDYRLATMGAIKTRAGISSAPVRIGERAWIGFNAIIMKGVQIGEASVIAAGSVVITDIPPYSIAAGNPAKVIKHIDATSQEQSKPNQEPIYEVV